MKRGYVLCTDFRDPAYEIDHNYISKWVYYVLCHMHFLSFTVCAPSQNSNLQKHGYSFKLIQPSVLNSRGTVSDVCVTCERAGGWWLDGPLHEQWHGQNVRAIWWQWGSWLMTWMCEMEGNFFVWTSDSVREHVAYVLVHVDTECQCVCVHECVCVCHVSTRWSSWQCFVGGDIEMMSLSPLPVSP